MGVGGCISLIPHPDQPLILTLNLGEDLPLTLRGCHNAENSSAKTLILSLDKSEQEFVFDNVTR